MTKFSKKSLIYGATLTLTTFIFETQAQPTGLDEELESSYRSVPVRTILEHYYNPDGTRNTTGPGSNRAHRFAIRDFAQRNNAETIADLARLLRERTSPAPEEGTTRASRPARQSRTEVHQAEAQPTPPPAAPLSTEGSGRPRAPQGGELSQRTTATSTSPTQPARVRPPQVPETVGPTPPVQAQSAAQRLEQRRRERAQRSVPATEEQRVPASSAGASDHPSTGRGRPVLRALTAAERMARAQQERAARLERDRQRMEGSREGTATTTDAPPQGSTPSQGNAPQGETRETGTRPQGSSRPTSPQGTTPAEPQPTTGHTAPTGSHAQGSTASTGPRDGETAGGTGLTITTESIWPTPEEFVPMEALDRISALGLNGLQIGGVHREIRFADGETATTAEEARAARRVETGRLLGMPLYHDGPLAHRNPEINDYTDPASSVEISTSGVPFLRQESAFTLPSLWAVYPTLQLPKTVVAHPYNPAVGGGSTEYARVARVVPDPIIGEDGAGSQYPPGTVLGEDRHPLLPAVSRYSFPGQLRVPFFVQLDTATIRPDLPETVREAIGDVDDTDLQVNVTFQDVPYKIKGSLGVSASEGTYLTLRPGGAVIEDATPSTNRNIHIQAGIFHDALALNSGGTASATSARRNVCIASTCYVHGGVSSPNNLAISGLTEVGAKTYAPYIVVKWQDGTRTKAHVTLTGFMSDRAFESALDGLSDLQAPSDEGRPENFRTLIGFYNSMRRSPIFNPSEGGVADEFFAKVRNLLRLEPSPRTTAPTEDEA